MEILRVIVAAAFALLALVCLRLWRTRRSRASAWLAVTFSALAAGLLLGRLHAVAPELGPILVPLQRVGVVAFPYLLFRFAASLVSPPRALRYAADAAAVTLLVASAVVPTPPEGTSPAWYLAYVVAVLAVWTALSSWVVWRLWHAGGAQPVVARRRLRMLSAAAAVLNLALVVAGITSAAPSPGWLTPTVQLVAFLSAVLFLLGFAAPSALRTVWRRTDERALWRAESQLVASLTADDVLSSMLPHLSRLLGGGPALFVDRFGNERSHGVVTPALRSIVLSGSQPPPLGRYDEFLVLDLRSGRLGVAASPVTPLFGGDEVELARWIGNLTDLALGRIETHDRERAARAQAEELSRELEALVYGITHDLRNPIVSVLGYLECLTEDYGDRFDENGLHFLSRLRTNAQYMDRLIADLLALSRVGRVPEVPEPVDLTAVTNGVADELGSVHPDATIEVRDLPEVLMDPSRARQLMTNLVSNALVHSGRADVTVMVDSPEAPAIPGQACIAVRDDGRGIPAAYRRKVFGLFERLEHGDKETNGTGIGLAMCQRIVSQAGGRIWIADSDAGADVRVQLPLAVRTPAGREG